MDLEHSPSCNGHWQSGPDRPVHCDACAYQKGRDDGFEAGCAVPYEEESDLTALREASAALIASLPRCQKQGCPNVATFGYGDGVKHCSQDIRDIDVSLKYAAPLRALQALLEKEKE